MKGAGERIVRQLILKVEGVRTDLEIPEEVRVGHILCHVIARVGTQQMVIHTAKEVEQVVDMYSD
jgi:hypothetical protein